MADASCLERVRDPPSPFKREDPDILCDSSRRPGPGLERRDDATASSTILGSFRHTRLTLDYHPASAMPTSPGRQKPRCRHRKRATCRQAALRIPRIGRRADSAGVRRVAVLVRGAMSPAAGWCAGAAFFFSGMYFAFAKDDHGRLRGGGGGGHLRVAVIRARPVQQPAGS